MPPTPLRPPWLPWALALLVLAGVGLRLRHVAQGRGMWHDESKLALLALPESERALPPTSKLNQVLPPGTLAAIRLAGRLAGSWREPPLRTPALLGSLAALLGLSWLAWRHLSPWGAVAAVGLLALGVPQVTYAWEVKQYGVEVGVGVGLLAAALASPGWGLVPALWVAALAPWFSIPAVFVLPGLLLDRALLDPPRPDRRLGWALLALVASALPLLAWAVSRRRGTASLMDWFWAPEFLPWGGSLGEQLAWVGSRLAGLVGPVLGVEPLAPVAGALVLLGLWGARRRERWVLALPFVFWLLAAALHLYPAGVGPTVTRSRLSLGLAPLVLWLLARGLGTLEAGRARPLAPVAALALLGAALARTPARYGVPSRLPLFQRVVGEYQEGDAILLTPGALMDWHYFAATGRIPVEIARQARGDGVVFRLPGRPRRIWWVRTDFYHLRKTQARRRERLLASYVPARYYPPERLVELWYRRDEVGPPGS